MGYARFVARARGARQPWDEEPTLQVPPEEPTLTAQIDVRATLAKVDAELAAAAEIEVQHEDPEELRAPADVEERTVAGAVAVLVASEQPPSSRRPFNTLPLVAPSDLQDGPAPPSSQRVEHEAPPPGASRASSGAIADDGPIEIPGLGAPRRGVRTIALGVLAACALLGTGALARHLWPEAKKDPAAASAASPLAMSATAATPSPAAASAAPTEPSPATASAAPVAPSPASASPVAPSPAAASAAPTEPSPAAASATPAPTAVAAAAPNALRPAERHPPTPRPATKPAGPARPSGRGPIVRDAPF
jgi:hypothetical protein